MDNSDPKVKLSWVIDTLRKAGFPDRVRAVVEHAHQKKRQEVQQTVERLLNTAVDDNGCDDLVWNCTALNVARDLVELAEELEDQDPEDLVMVVAQWQVKRKKAAMT